MSYFYMRDDEFLTSDINKTFGELLRSSDREFSKWVDDFCSEITEQWDTKDHPPKVGVRIEEVGSEFERVCNVDTSKMWFKDELTRLRDCVIDTSNITIASNFFPNILKAKDTVGNGKAISVYDLYSDPKCRSTILKILTRSIKKDTFYTFSPVYKCPPTFTGNLRKEALRFVEDTLTKESSGTGNQSLWLELVLKNERRIPRISGLEIKSLHERGLLTKVHLGGINPTSVDDTSLFRIRPYGIKDKSLKVIPTIFGKVELGASSAPTNFPVANARLLYKYITDRFKDQNEIVIYDPSMGFGGRLLGALSLRDRSIHYVGTDPNTGNWLPEIGISRYEYMERVFKSHIRSGKEFKGTYLCSGSEEVSKLSEFQKFKGKVDFVFTSPPYFAAEIYSDEATQSSIKYKEYESWRDKFLRPTLTTCVEWLKNDRHLAFNIADVTIGAKQYPLEEDTVQILKELGLSYEGKLKMVLTRSPSMKVHKNLRHPNMKNFCVINGKWRKYEPIFIFYKS